MIPRFGRVIPFVIAVLGVFDAKYAWESHKVTSIFVGVVTIFLIYFMFKRHDAVSPKRAIHHIATPFILMLVIVVTTYFLFF